MNDWLAIGLVTLVIVLIVGNFSTFKRSSNQKMRPKSLNDLEETLPRTHKKPHKMETKK